jgi:hypothetical protein
MCSYVRYIVPIGALFSVVLWLGNACYLYLSVSFIQMLKAAMPVAVFVVGVCAKTTQYSHRTAANMAVVGVGIAIASYGEINFVVVGVVLQLIAIFCESFRIVLIQVRGTSAKSTCGAVGCCAGGMLAIETEHRCYISVPLDREDVHACTVCHRCASAVPLCETAVMCMMTPVPRRCSCSRAASNSTPSRRCTTSRPAASSSSASRSR